MKGKRGERVHRGFEVQEGQENDGLSSLGVIILVDYLVARDALQPV